MPHPQEVFEQPQEYWTFLCAPRDEDFEGQHFDRKEAGRCDASGHVGKPQFSGVMGEITETVSAFANSNKEGGLLILGVSSAGSVKGIEHLSDEQRNRLTNIGLLLANQSTDAKQFECVDADGNTHMICLIFVHYTEHGICETPSASPNAWLRHGAQNVAMNQLQRDQIKRDKRIVDWESGICCPFDPAELDHDVVTEFRKGYLSDAGYDLDDLELLWQAGALNKEGKEFFFTNAGFLFFSTNPQRKLAASYIRLLRYEVPDNLRAERGLPTFERSFKGSVTKQIRNVRSFFQQSGFFKLYQRRNPEGGFIEEPEYPFIAVDEAIVNAVAHRDFATTLPIECESYRNAFVVANPGRLLQRDHDVPPEFTLATTTLVSTPRNPRLIEWLKAMRDGQGAAFVRVLSEGTKRMRDEMAKLALPAPVYKTGDVHTTVILYNNADEREAAILGVAARPTEYTNLYPLSVISGEGSEMGSSFIEDRQRPITNGLREALEANGWYIDRHKYGKLTAHHRGVTVPVPPQVASIVRLYPAYTFQIRHYWGRHYLCVDYTLEVKNVRTVQSLLGDLPASDLTSRSAAVQLHGWQWCRIIAADAEYTRISLSDSGVEEMISSRTVIPNLSKTLIAKVLNRQHIEFDLSRKIKEASLAQITAAARSRAERTQLAVDDIAETAFPLIVDDAMIELNRQPALLFRRGNSATWPNLGLQVSSIAEPSVEFDHQQSVADIREGITSFGAYGHSPAAIELVPICVSSKGQEMVALIERLKNGKYRYRGAERTFHTRFNYSSIVTIPAPELALQECTRLLQEHSDWPGHEPIDRIFLVHTPEGDYAADDEQSPYFMVKRFLLEQGVPCQMIDTPTITNPEWKDLNLALNIVAKCGVTPWVLPDAIPDADFFVGLSYTRHGQADAERLMGYANVFNRYGKWEFYSGNTEVFPYENRIENYQRLVRNTMKRLSLSETPSIYFHYAAKFSSEDRDAMLTAARSVRPLGTYSFVWINTDHAVRLYDSQPKSDGSLSRGSYAIGSPNQIYLSTTGSNPFRRALGTPEMLEINTRTVRPDNSPNARPDLRSIAVQVLSLTKLNWASTDSLCGVPITTKYASDIAYLTSAFLRQGGAFRLHRVLETTPWFL